MREINVCPSTLAEGFHTYSPFAIRKLFSGQKVSHILEFGNDQLNERTDVIHSIQRFSISGAQEKFPAIIDNGKIRLPYDDERPTYVIKPAPWDETISTRKQIPANENLTMQIASQVYGITTAENGLCFTSKGEIVYITKRFDINPDGTKNQMEDFASLLGKSTSTNGENFKYDGCYEDIADIIKKYIPAWMVSMEEFYKLIIFNYIYGNGDGHIKNFSIIKKGADYILSPAYDLINTNIHLSGDDFGLIGGLSYSIPKSETYKQTGHPCKVDFERFGTKIGIREKRIKMILDLFTFFPEASMKLITNSFLSEKLRRSYIRVVNTRIQRFVRESE